MTGDKWADVVVVGGGLAGAAAAIAAVRLGAAAMLLEPMTVGGEVMNIPEVDGLPESDPVSGPDLVAALMQRVMAEGVDFRLGETATALEADARGWVIQTETGAVSAAAVVLATGAAPVPLPGRPDPDGDPLVGAGLFTCAPCDAPLYAGKRVAVIGGGDTGADAAVTLSGYAAEVVLFERQRALSCRAPARDRVGALANVVVRCATEVGDVARDDATGTMLVSDSGGAAERVDGVMLAVGMRPRSELAEPHAELDEAGAVLVAADLATTARGLYAAGDVRAGSPYRCAAAWGDGTTAACAAVRAAR